MTLKQQSKKAHPFLSSKHLTATPSPLHLLLPSLLWGEDIHFLNHLPRGRLPLYPLSFVTISTQCDPRHQMWSDQGREQRIGSLHILIGVLWHFPDTNLLGRSSEISSSSQSQPPPPDLFYISCLQIRFPLFHSLAHFWCKSQRAHILGFEGRTDSMTTTHWHGIIEQPCTRWKTIVCLCSDKALFIRTSNWQIWLTNHSLPTSAQSYT